MQTKTFSRISFLVVLIVSGFMLVRLAQRAASVIPPPEFPGTATSTEVSAPAHAENFATTSIRAPRGTIHALVATTTAERERGLGGRSSIPGDSGMLFVFDQPGSYGFWMKDTLFPLDFVWLDPGKRVAGVDRGVSPETYPEVFYPPAEIGYVLELNSGGAAKYGIATGTQLVF